MLAVHVIHHLDGLAGERLAGYVVLIVPHLWLSPLVVLSIHEGAILGDCGHFSLVDNLNEYIH